MPKVDPRRGSTLGDQALEKRDTEVLSRVSDSHGESWWRCDSRVSTIGYQAGWGCAHKTIGRAEVEIRQALIEDAASACQVLRRSISELCVADHQNDPEILRPWLANKTPEIVASWIVKPGNTVLLAVENRTILGVGLVTRRGEITLNYVSPDARCRGVSRALIGALEDRAIHQGNKRCSLTSTVTARRFYRSIGYSEDGPPAGKFGTTGSFPMSKALTRVT